MVKYSFLFDAIMFVCEFNCTCDNSVKWSRAAVRGVNRKMCNFREARGENSWHRDDPKLAGGAKGDQELHPNLIFTVPPTKYSNLFRRNKLLFKIIALFPVPSKWTECRVLTNPFKDTASGKMESETFSIQSKAFPSPQSGWMKSERKKKNVDDD